MIFDYQAEIVEVFWKKLMRDAFWSIIYKICEFQPFWMIFWKFCNKISLFLAIFLEFFGLRNNLTLQEPLYTRNISPILYTERNKKNHFSNKFNLQVCKLNLARQTQTKQVFGKSTWTCEQHYHQVLTTHLARASAFRK